MRENIELVKEVLEGKEFSRLEYDKIRKENGLCSFQIADKYLNFKRIKKENRTELSPDYVIDKLNEYLCSSEYSGCGSYRFEGGRVYYCEFIFEDGKFYYVEYEVRYKI